MARVCMSSFDQVNSIVIQLWEVVRRMSHFVWFMTCTFVDIYARVCVCVCVCKHERGKDK